MILSSLQWYLFFFLRNFSKSPICGIFSGMKKNFRSTNANTILKTLEPRLFISKRFVKETLFPSFPIIHLSFDIYISFYPLHFQRFPNIFLIHFHTFSNIDEHKFKILPIHSIDTRTWWKHSCHRSPFIARIDNFRDNTAARVILDAIEGDCARHRWNENAMECSAEVTIKGVDRSWETGVRCSR